MHKDEDDVQTYKAAQGTERKLLSADMRKKGIFNENKAQAMKEDPKYQAERRNSVKNLVLCSKCSGFYSRKMFHRHKVNCVGDSSSLPSAVDVKLMSNTNSKFNVSILSRFQNDEAGLLCKTDATIRSIGERLFERTKRKVDKEMETRKSVMNDMRLLAKLYISFNGQDNSPESTDSEVMFRRQNFCVLEASIEEVTTKPGADENTDMKHGVKNKLFYLLRSAAQIIKATHLANCDDAKAKECENFVELLNLNQSQIFGDATYKINKIRQEKLRMPEQRACETEVAKLREHIMTKITEYSNEYNIVDKSTFVALRDALCARITLCNARRGGEPSRLKISQWSDALQKRWIDKESILGLEEWERGLFDTLLVCYMTGKGNHLVPVLIPDDCVPGMKVITDPVTRKDVGVLPPSENNYIFANTEKSVYHVTGWDCIHKLCEEAGIENPELLTASKQRHRISTKYAQLEMSERDRGLFFSHMGHTGEVNKGTYQYPLPILEVVQVGNNLQKFDQGKIYHCVNYGSGNTKSKLV